MPEAKWTSEENSLLHSADLIAEILRRRDADKPQDDGEKSLLRFLQSTGGTAIVTILLGSIFAPIVISYVQDTNSRQNQALDEYRQYLKLQQESVKDTYNLVGRMVFAAQDLITVTTPAFDVQTVSGDDRNELVKQSREMVKNYNDTIKEWRVKEAVQGVLVSYYFYGHGAVPVAWREAEKSVNEFVDCAEDIHQKWVRKHTLTDDRSRCENKKETISTALEGLSKSIEASRRYTWDQFEVPISHATTQSNVLASPTSSPVK